MTSSGQLGTQSSLDWDQPITTSRLHTIPGDPSTTGNTHVKEKVSVRNAGHACWELIESGALRFNPTLGGRRCVTYADTSSIRVSSAPEPTRIGGPQ
jgi:hypothetical protein